MDAAIVEVGGRQFPIVRAKRQDPLGLVEIDPVRWNASHSSDFDVHLEHLQASTLVFDWVSRFIQVPVKRLFQNSITVPSVHMGSFLSALEELTLNDRLEDMRNISNGKEDPPVYDVIELNSETSRDFLIEGIQFFERKSGVKYVISRMPTWHGMHFTVYTSVKDRAENAKLIDDAWQIATERSFLKGAAFSISGKFLNRGEEKWDDVFLDAAQQEPLERLVQTVNDRGAAMANRGVLMMGPPGTGKTLAARVVKNTANATFIWVSARDFYRMGTFGGLSMAFDLARMFAPTVICLEDIDNWLDSHSIDFLKTEMDGIDQSTGVSTLLTTNFPERFPEALIDRPGRFHDVIKIGLPQEPVRLRMLQRWCAGASAATLKAIAKETDGLSGAHIKELARFAETLASENGELGIDAAVQQALQKVVEQRELIAERHASSSRVARTERYDAVEGIVFNPAMTYTQAAVAAANREPERVNGTEITTAVVTHVGNGRPVDAELITDRDSIIQRVVKSTHPHDPITGRPFVDDVDTVAQAGSWRGSDMSIEFVCVTRRGDERNRNGSLVQIAEGGGFKGLKTEFWEAHRGTWLFGHGLMPGFQLPIGNSYNKKTERVEFSKSKHRMTARLFLSQTLPEAEVIAALIEEGILNCCSIQFLPIAGKELEPVTMAAPESEENVDSLVLFGRPLPFEFKESDLYENSVVPIPADAHAIRKGIETGKIGMVRVPQSVLPSLKLMAGPDTPAQSGWTPNVSPKAAEYRYYASIGEYTHEIVAPSADGLIKVMRAADIAPATQTAVNGSGVAKLDVPGIDYEGLTNLLRQNAAAVLPKPEPSLDLTGVQQAVADAFAPLAKRMEKQEQALRLITGSID